MQNPLAWIAAPVGRVLFAWIFVASGLGKFGSWQGTVQMMTDKGLPAPEALLSIAAVLEILGGAMVLFGFRARWGAFLLLLFMLPVTFIMHNFWIHEDQGKWMADFINFMKNISIIGGTLLVLAFGAGPLSIDSGLRFERPDPAFTPPAH